jgi:hypothetical protein
MTELNMDALHPMSTPNHREQNQYKKGDQWQAPSSLSWPLMKQGYEGPGLT